MSLETIIQFDHLESVKDFIENVIPEMLTENFIPRTELRETTMSILKQKKWVTIMIWYVLCGLLSLYISCAV